LLSYEELTNFNKCQSNSSAFNSTTENIFFSDIVSREQVYWWHWFWILAMLCLMQEILIILDRKAIISVPSQYFGTIVTVQESMRGPIIKDNSASQTFTR